MFDQQTDSSMIAWHMAGFIIGALVVVFVLTRLGFRFVVSAGIGGV
jgi:hypothetical protein